jgi:hypothetical protein
MNMAIIQNLPTFVTNPSFIGGAAVVILAIIAIIWWLHEEGKLKLPF